MKIDSTIQVNGMSDLIEHYKRSWEYLAHKIDETSRWPLHELAIIANRHNTVRQTDVSPPKIIFRHQFLVECPS
jgi:hypothetical protein